MFPRSAFLMKVIPTSWNIVRTALASTTDRCRTHTETPSTGGGPINGYPLASVAANAIVDTLHSVGSDDEAEALCHYR